jgi:hypothetical protein
MKYIHTPTQTIFLLLLLLAMATSGSFAHAHPPAPAPTAGAQRMARLPISAAARSSQPARTLVAGDITVDTTWTKAGSPYQAATTTVRPDVTLTVEPGVEVRFANNTGLTILGTLKAQGTAEAPILFTGAAAAPGAWRGIEITGNATAPLSGSVLEHVTIEYGGLPLGTSANLFLKYATATISWAAIRGGLGAGIYTSVGGVAHISDTTITANQGQAIEFHEAAVNPTLARITASGNGSDTIGLGGGNLTGEHIWEAAGLPYRALPGNTVITVMRDAVLTIEPDVTVLFDHNASLRIRGRLQAEGSADRPITLTAATKQPGFWQGLNVEGTAETLAGAVLRYVTVEYGGLPFGDGANIRVLHGQLLMAHSIVRNGGAHGIFLGDAGSNSTIETSQITGNSRYAVLNIQPERPVLAANNWWGTADGPAADGGCANGTGGKVSRGVAVKPFLSGPNVEPGVIVAADARLLTLTPQRVFAPANDLTRVWVEITLRDGAGNPVPGRTVRLLSSLGKVVDGGITDVQGRTFAYLTSATPGDATLSVLLDQSTSCEFARSAEAKVTFTPDDDSDILIPDAAAPYISQYIRLSPERLVRGVPALLSTTLTNPGATPIVVEGSFSYAQSGIGLTFGPLGTSQQLTIPPKGAATFTTPFTPPIEGHYCFRFEYSYSLADTSAAAMPAAGRMRALQLNTNVSASTTGNFPHFLDGVQPGPERPNWHPDEGIDASLSHFWRNLFGSLSQTSQQFHNNNSMPPLNRWDDSHKIAPQSDRLASALAMPATAGLDYRQISLPRQLSLPPRQPGNGVSAARAAAENAGTQALVAALVKLEAATIASERYRSATEARDLQWASLQASAADFYAQQASTALRDSADAIDAYVKILRSEGLTALPISIADVRAYQGRLRTQGFNPQELAELRLIGTDNAAIEAERQGLISLAPERMVGDALARLEQLADAYRGMAEDLHASSRFESSQPDQQAGATPDHRLARAGAIQNTIQIGNPFDTSTTIDLRLRPIDLPPDWIVTLSASSIELAPGQQRPVTVTIVPGTTVQGSIAQVAVEGYAAGNLVDGVAFSVAVPRQQPFDGRFHAYLPVVQR